MDNLYCALFYKHHLAVTFIYGLICPLEDVVRYIGKSVAPETRLKAHIAAAVRGNYSHHTARWIAKLNDVGMVPRLVILETVLSGQDWRIAERTWIQNAQEAGWPLTNSTAGGEGLDYIDPEAKAKYLKNLSAAMKRYAASDEGRAKIALMKAASMTAEVHAKRRLGMKAAWSDPDKSALMGAALAKMQSDPEIAKRRVVALKAYWTENRQELIAKIWTPETRAKQSVGRKADWADPETRERMMNRWTPEAKAKQAAELATRQAKIQAARTPEVRAKQAAALKATWAKRKAAKLAELAKQET